MKKTKLCPNCKEPLEIYGKVLFRCKNCIFFEVFKNGKTTGGVGRKGICHRYPPQISSQDILDSPYEENWCGEYKKLKR